jgi:hypothetical protein
MSGNSSGLIKKIALVGGIYYLAALGCNHIIQDDDYRNGNYHSVSRADGAFQKTELTVYSNNDFQEDELYHFKLFGSSFFINDGGTHNKRDGLVDKLYFTGSIFSKLSGEYTREHDYSRLKKEFDAADKLLAKTKKRFSKHF